MDTVDKETRSRIMSAVKCKNTGPELSLRKAIHRRGLRYRLHDATLPGTPDIIFPQFHALIFVHGCFWHSHGCKASTKPETRREFWNEKFIANQERDARKINALLNLGWRVMIVWECTIKAGRSCGLDDLSTEVMRWLKSEETLNEK